MQIGLDSHWQLRIALVLIVASFAASAHAQTPQYRHVVFITSTTNSVSSSAETNPNPGLSVIGGHSSADLQVTRRANAAGLLSGWNGSDRIFKAVIATNSSNAIDRIPIEWPVYNTNNELLADDSDQFWNGTLFTGINYSEFGTKLNDNTPFWTGCSDSGTASQNCSNWSATISQFANVGYSDATSFILNQAQLPCGQARRLLAISPAILLGDFDRDNDVDGRDFLIWQRYEGVAANSLPDEERYFPAAIVAGGGLEGWHTNYGVAVEPLTASTAVPEPSSIFLVGLASLALLRRP